MFAQLSDYQCLVLWRNTAVNPGIDDWVGTVFCQFQEGIINHDWSLCSSQLEISHGLPSDFDKMPFKGQSLDMHKVIIVGVALVGKELNKTVVGHQLSLLISLNYKHFLLSLNDPTTNRSLNCDIDIVPYDNA